MAREPDLQLNYNHDSSYSKHVLDQLFSILPDILNEVGDSPKDVCAVFQLAKFCNSGSNLIPCES